jgi:hypothetical protein
LRGRFSHVRIYKHSDDGKFYKAVFWKVNTVGFHRSN